MRIPVSYHVSLRILEAAFLALMLMTFVSAETRAADRTAPDWTLSTPDERQVRLSDEATQGATILYFWATWCPYCQALAPHLQSMRLEYGKDVEVLAINIFEDGDPVAAIENSGYDFTLLLDGDHVAELYGISGTPGVVILDGEREIRFDLLQAPDLDLPAEIEAARHTRRAAWKAPYWAAQIRRAIDEVLDTDH